MILQHLLKAPSLAPVPHRALVSVTGSQSSEFLNGLLSTSFQGKPLNRFSSILHAQGRVMYDVFLYGTDNGYLLEYDSRPSEAPSLISYFKRHVLRSKVKVRSVTEEYDIWASWGSEKDHGWETDRKWHWAKSGAIEPAWETNDWPWGTEDLVLRDRRGVGMGRRLLVKKGDRPPEAATHDILSADAYLEHRISRGVAEGVKDIPPMQAFPIDSNLDIMGGLDFRKGCYVGQELTVRTYHTGVIRKRISPVKLVDEHGEAVEAASVLENAEIKPATKDDAFRRPRGTGKLLSSTKDVGLALLRLEHISAVRNGTVQLQIDVESRKINVVPFWPDWWPDLQHDNLSDA
ncbi:hypothetical protein D9613_005200 [Agrocybe pediades]|uniref:CAF17 C-terminal domain-containing protein n=1 Tax=Agrocybe pediades TaxID=84607 RepID=A0A8H4VQY7_9AGAR|nr:hypothetical protein D9613_005200 [Agrocybe pediades]KAF9569040.1 Aminomethyltransferase folate-binding domain-containing protein [Agrocybe pediades]